MNCILLYFKSITIYFFKLYYCTRLCQGLNLIDNQFVILANTAIDKSGWIQVQTWKKFNPGNCLNHRVVIIIFKESLQNNLT